MQKRHYQSHFLHNGRSKLITFWPTSATCDHKIKWSLISNQLILHLWMMRVHQTNWLFEQSLWSVWQESDKRPSICIMLHSPQGRPAVVIYMRPNNPCNTNLTTINYELSLMSFLAAGRNCNGLYSRCVPHPHYKGKECHSNITFSHQMLWATTEHQILFLCCESKKSNSIVLIVTWGNRKFTCQIYNTGTLNVCSRIRKWSHKPSNT